MDNKRLLIFLVLAAVIMYVTPRLLPQPPRPAAKAVSAGVSDSTQAASTAVPPAASAESAKAAAPVAPPAPAVRPDTVTVNNSLATYRFSTVGAAPLGATLRNYRALSRSGGQVELARRGVPLLAFGILEASRDTVWLRDAAFSVDSSARGPDGAPVLTFRGAAGADSVVITYSVAPDNYLLHVAGRVTSGSGDARALLVSMPEGLNSAEADSADDERHLSYVTKSRGDDPKSIDFHSVDPQATRTVNGPLVWVASKNKYFVAVLLADTARSPFAGAVVTGGPRVKNVPPSRATATTILALPAGGAFTFTLYAGPQEWRRLLALGHDLENVNPYGGFLRPIIQPFATLLMRLLLWTHDHFRINYGWVVVILGVALRVVLWPLYQSSMRAQLRLQRLQPELQDIQKRHKNAPEKLQAEMMRVYREHGMSPFSPLAGCLPMLIPMPILYALYYVFQNTIEFRGVSFLWLADISQKDPYFILPVLMGVSMFLMSWIGLRSSPPNAQAKMMAYAMPVVLTVLFAKFAAGLNLYYAVQNIAALPQQWFIAAERAKATQPAIVSGPAERVRET